MTTTARNVRKDLFNNHPGHVLTRCSSLQGSCSYYRELQDTVPLLPFPR